MTAHDVSKLNHDWLQSDKLNYHCVRMADHSNLFVLGLGLVLGLKHATEADHIAAVSTFVGAERRLTRACAIGLSWGLGHTLALFAASLVVIGLKIPMTRWLADRLELGVAVMLIVLGARLIASVHSKWHAHHHDFDWKQCGLKPLLVGIMHGAAGSSALMLLVLSTISSTTHALMYILVFGAGSMAGMLLISILVAAPIHWASRRIANSLRPIQIAAGAFSCFSGLVLGVNVWRTMM